MARENLVFLRGSVVKPPTIVKKEDGAYSHAYASINVGRSERTVGDYREKYMKCDNPSIITRDVEIIKGMSTWKKNDIVDIKGVISSKSIKKKSFCSHCGNSNSLLGSLVFVYPIYAEKITHIEGSDKDVLNYLVKHREVLNQVYVFGTLCRDPRKTKTEKDLVIVEYQIALNRKYRIKEDPIEIKSDYPWVKAYGEIGTDCFEHLRCGSEIYIDGCLQSRNIERKAVCGQLYSELGKPVKDIEGNPVMETNSEGLQIGCGNEYLWHDRALEIVPYSVEYISDYLLDEDLEAIKEKELMDKFKTEYNDEVSFGDD